MRGWHSTNAPGAHPRPKPVQTREGGAGQIARRRARTCPLPNLAERCLPHGDSIDNDKPHGEHQPGERSVIGASAYSTTPTLLRTIVEFNKIPLVCGRVGVTRHDGPGKGMAGSYEMPARWHFPGGLLILGAHGGGERQRSSRIGTRMTATAPKQFPQPSRAPCAASRPIESRPAPQPPAGDGGRGPRDGDSRGVRARHPAHRNREGSHDARTAYRDVRRPGGLPLARWALAGAAPAFGTLRPLPGRGPDTWCHRRPIPGACRPIPGPAPSRHRAFPQISRTSLPPQYPDRSVRSVRRLPHATVAFTATSPAADAGR